MTATQEKPVVTRPEIFEPTHILNGEEVQLVMVFGPRKRVVATGWYRRDGSRTAPAKGRKATPIHPKRTVQNVPPVVEVIVEAEPLRAEVFDAVEVEPVVEYVEPVIDYAIPVIDSPIEELITQPAPVEEYHDAFEGATLELLDVDVAQAVLRAAAWPIYDEALGYAETLRGDSATVMDKKSADGSKIVRVCMPGRAGGNWVDVLVPRLIGFQIAE